MTIPRTDPFPLAEGFVADVIDLVAAVVGEDAGAAELVGVVIIENRFEGDGFDLGRGDGHKRGDDQQDGDELEPEGVGAQIQTGVAT